MLITERVEGFIRRHRLAPPEERIVVAVSGGADSLCLLDCLDRLGYPLLVAHLDHRLRPASWADAEFVLRLARDRALPCIVERVRGPGLDQRGMSVEEAARQERYRFLAACARTWEARRIATGHTAGDQAETVLMHFLRGAGVDGLRGILPRSSLGDWVGPGQAGEVELIRPLLETTRLETEAHCLAAGLRPRRDRSNEDTTFFRNRLRHELLPLLESYNPGIRAVLARTARVMARQAALVEGLAVQAEPEVTVDEPGAVKFDRKAFVRCPEPVQAALLRRAAARLVPRLRDFGFDAVDLARARLAEPQRGRRTPLPSGLELIDRGESVVLTALGARRIDPWLPQLEDQAPLRLEIPGELPLAHGSRLAAALAAPPSSAASERDRSGMAREAWLDADRLQDHLWVRPPRAGERMQPLGMDGHRKLADIFNSLRIPPEARRRWPVVLSGDEVVWLAGLRLSHIARVTATATRAVRLRIEAADGGEP